MSGKNKVNPDHYKLAGRLTPDDLARERRKQTEPMFGAKRGRQGKATPPWFAAGQEADQNAEAVAPDDAVSMNTRDADEAAQRPQAKTRPKQKGKGTTRDARSAKAKPRSTPKASRASGTPKGGKAPRARASAPRAAAKKSSSKTKSKAKKK